MRKILVHPPQTKNWELPQAIDTTADCDDGNDHFLRWGQLVQQTTSRKQRCVAVRRFYTVSITRRIRVGQTKFFVQFTLLLPPLPMNKIFVHSPIFSRDPRRCSYKNRKHHRSEQPRRGRRFHLCTNCQFLSLNEHIL